MAILYSYVTDNQRGTGKFVFNEPTFEGTTIFALNTALVGGNGEMVNDDDPGCSLR